MTHNIAAALLDRATPIDELHPHPLNARRRDARARAALRESLQENGQYRTVIARRLDDGSLQLLAGHGTVEQARELGWDQVAADVHDGVDDQAALRIVAIDNRSSDLAGYDDALQLELLEALRELRGSGYDAGDIAELRANVAAALAGSGPVALTDPDEAPGAPDVPLSQAGDVWLLGPHRLVCGDATDEAAWAALLGEDLVDAVWTDPPYGVSYEGGTTEKLTIVNDDRNRASLEALLRPAFTLARDHTRPGGAWYVAYADKAGSVLPFLTVLDELRIYRQNIAWVKDRFVLSHGDYHSRYEPIAYGWHPGAARLVPVADRTQDTVWEIPRPSRSAEHPTMKPVELITRALENSTRPGHLVADPFAGSGSTLIACHHTGRIARLLELDPRYADVICRRWQEHTGVKPILEATGEAHDFTTERANP